jgi:hypothetical protein
MSWNPFSWLRAAARNAVVGGIEDALEIVGDDGALVIEIRRRELPSLPTLAAIGDEEAPKPRKK